MPTTVPKCSPPELMGLLLVLNEHGGREDMARLANDLGLEIDEILPASDYAEALQLLRVSGGTASLTELGRKLLRASIGQRKEIFRDQLRRTPLFKTLLAALEKAPERRLSDEEIHRIVAFTTATADDLIQNIINWGRFAELFRYDSDQHLLLPSRLRRTARPAARAPKGPPPTEPASPDEAPLISALPTDNGSARDTLLPVGSGG